MFDKNIDFLAIGDITTDAFIKIEESNGNCHIDNKNSELCMEFGSKVPFEYVKIIKAVGNSVNASIAVSRLGINSGLISNIGSDQNGLDCIEELKKEKIDSRYIDIHKDKATNYHFVLWYGIDRTILINHILYNYKFPKIKKPPKWIYLSSLASNAFKYHLEIADYLNKNPEVKLAFQPGTFQIELGISKLKDIYKRTEVFICNVEEAKKILHTDSNDIKTLLTEIYANGPKIIIITDGPNGSFMLDGEHFYFMQKYPDPRPPIERTGCGDAFSATFIAFLMLGKSPLEALTYAPINPMSVAQYIGSREGLLNLENIEWWLKQAPSEYNPKEI